MKTSCLVMMILALSCTVLTACESSPKSGRRATFNGWTKYGPHVSADGDVIANGALRGDEQNIVVNGTITEVCKIKGCWMKVKTEFEDDLFVQFKDYGFFVPRNSTGHDVILHGVAEKRIMTVEMLQHYAHDANKSQSEIDAITQSETRVIFYADSVMIQGKGLEKAPS